MKRVLKPSCLSQFCSHIQFILSLKEQVAPTGLQETEEVQKEYIINRIQ